MWKNIKNWVVFQFNSLWNLIHFGHMKRKAERMHNLTGKQYFVVPKTKTSLMVVDNTYIKWHNKIASKNKGRKITHPDLLKMCYYKTASGAYKH